MTIKTKQGKRGSCNGLQRYLEKADRALARACSPTIGDPERWGKEMDDIRIAAGKNDGRRYYHFILSPDPKDNPSVEDVMDLARAWAIENYPDGQWVVDIHNDNKGRICHAHIALNAYNPSTGLKIHRNDSKIKREARSLNRLKAERGMSILPDIDDISVGERKFTRVESELRDRGFTPWKDRLRDAIETIAPLSKDFIQFQSSLRALGIEVYTNKRGQLVYVPPKEWKGHSCKDVKLGSHYELDSLNTVFKIELDIEVDKWGKAKLNHPMPSFHIPERKPISYADLLQKRARPYKQIRVQRLANAIKVLNTNKIDSSSSLDIKLIEIRDAIEQTKVDIETAQEKMGFATLAVEKIAVLNRYDRVWGLYRDASKRERVKLAKDYPDTVKDCLEAFEWLSNRGLDTEESYKRIEGYSIENHSHIETMKSRLVDAELALKILEATAKTIESIDEVYGYHHRPKRRPSTISTPATLFNDGAYTVVEDFASKYRPQDVGRRKGKTVLDISERERRQHTDDRVKDASHEKAPKRNEHGER